MVTIAAFVLDQRNAIAVCDNGNCAGDVLEERRTQRGGNLIQTANELSTRPLLHPSELPQYKIALLLGWGDGACRINVVRK